MKVIYCDVCGVPLSGKIEWLKVVTKFFVPRYTDKRTHQTYDYWTLDLCYQCAEKTESFLLKISGMEEEKTKNNQTTKLLNIFKEAKNHKEEESGQYKRIMDKLKN